MKIYNLRIERKEGMSYLICDMEAKFTDVKTVWYSVHQEYEDWLNTDVYDSFLIAALYPAMFYKEDIIIEGLFFNVKNYVQDIIRAFHPEFRKANVKVQGFSNPHQIAKNVGTGFSAGVDSFSTIYDHLERESDENYKISSLFFSSPSILRSSIVSSRISFSSFLFIISAAEKIFAFIFICFAMSTFSNTVSSLKSLIF